MTETPSTVAYDDLVAKNRNLCDSIGKLVDEKADLETSNAVLLRERNNFMLANSSLHEANERLAAELKACIAEKGELQRQLALKSGMGIQENRPEVFADLKKG